MLPMPATAKKLAAIILAAGEGQRLVSSLPKALHEIGGKPLLRHVLDAVAGLAADDVYVVVGRKAAQVREAIGSGVHWVTQEQRLGTGHAVAQALPLVDDAAIVLVLYADVPLVSTATLKACVAAAANGALALVTAHLDQPGALGRIKRDGDARIQGIVEFRDANPEERDIREINSGILALSAAPLRRLLRHVKPDNAQGEHYLTDVVGLARTQGIAVQGVAAADAEEVAGVNDRAQLAALERLFQRRQAQRLMDAGVTVADPARLDIRGTVSAGPDSFIDVNVVLKGRVRLAAGAQIGPGAVIKDANLGIDARIGPGVVMEDADLGDGVRVEAYTVIEGASIGDGCRLGPFARLRPGTELGAAAQVGNFVETKKARLGAGVKANHLAYLGDAEVGADSNIGAGAITCNYDGARKHRTEIGASVFVGSNATLVAPLVVKAGAYIAAGSTITAEVPEDALALGRGKQRNIAGWTRPYSRRKPGR